MKQFISSLILLLIGYSTIAQNLNEPLTLDPAVKTGKLPNGLTYFIRPNKKPEQRVELRLVVNAGSICEDDDQQGLAHMAEHMAFNGTKNFRKNEIVSFLQDIGVGFGNDLNAYTSFDETVYILPIPTDKPGNLEKGFKVLEDWAHNVTYLTEDIEGERAIILEESRLGKGAGERMFKKIYPSLFEGSKYARRLPIGIDSIIKNFPPDAIRRFYKDWYRPDLMAVIVVGDITAEKAEEMIRAHFSGLVNPASPKPRVYAEVIPYQNSKAVVASDKEATAYAVSVNYPYFRKEAARTVGGYRSDLIRNLFSIMARQRLQELTQKENPPYLGASLNFGSFARGYDGFSVNANTGTGDVIRGLSAVVEEFERIKRFGFTAAELERAKKSLLANYERSYNDRDKTESDNYVEEYIQYFLEQTPSPGIESEYNYVKSLLPGIRLEEVNDVVKPFRDQKNRFVYITGPEAKENAALPDAQSLLAAIDAKEKAELKPYEEKAIAANLLSKTPRAGKVISKTVNTQWGTTELKLSNGVTVSLKKTDFKNDQVIMTAGRAGGKNNYGIKDKFNAEYATALVAAMGYGEFNPTDLRKALAGKTVSVTPVFSEARDGVRGNSTVKDLETLLQLTYLQMTSPRRDSSLFKSYVQKNKSQYAMLGSNPQASFIDTLFKSLYQNNPMAPIALPNSSYFDKIDLDRAVAIYQERFGDATGMHFVFAGSFSEEQLVPLIEKYIAALPASGKTFKAVDNKVRTLPGKKSMTVNKGKEQQSLILAFFNGELPYSDAFELKADVLSEILNIRIIEELREKIQGIYGGGTFSQVEKAPYGNFSFILQLPCGPEKVDTLIKAVNKEFELIRTKGPEQSYLDKVKKQLIEQHKVTVKDNSAWATQILENRIDKFDPVYFLDYEKKVQALTLKDIQAVAKTILGGPNQFTAVLLPETVVKEGEKKKGF